MIPLIEFSDSKYTLTTQGRGRLDNRLSSNFSVFLLQEYVVVRLCKVDLLDISTCCIRLRHFYFDLIAPPSHVDTSGLSAKEINLIISSLLTRNVS